MRAVFIRFRELKQVWERAASELHPIWNDRLLHRNVVVLGSTQHGGQSHQFAGLNQIQPSEISGKAFEVEPVMLDRGVAQPALVAQVREERRRDGGKRHRSTPTRPTPSLEIREDHAEALLDRATDLLAQRVAWAPPGGDDPVDRSRTRRNPSTWAGRSASVCAPRVPWRTYRTASQAERGGTRSARRTRAH